MKGIKIKKIIICYLLILIIIISVYCDNEKEKEEAVTTVNAFVKKYNGGDIMNDNEIIYYGSNEKIVFYIKCLYAHCGKIKSYVFESDIDVERSSLIEEIKFSKEYVLAKGRLFFIFDNCAKRLVVEVIKYTPVCKEKYKIYDIIEM